jgi:hypothetical protein
MPADVKRLELARIRVCGRCGRGGAELRGADCEKLVVPLDAVRARQLSEAGRDDDRSLTELVLEQLAASGAVASEVVLDASDGRLCAFLSLVRPEDAEPEVVACTAEEGVALAIRGALKLYATEEALAQAARSAKPERGTGGSDTIH